MKFIYRLSIVLFVLKSFSLNAQNSLDSISDIYRDYNKTPKEIVYCHLNKVKFLKGESIAFKAYVVDKSTKRLSQTSTNLYCRILDEDKKVIKEGLYLLEGGLSNNIITVDSLFTKRNYYFQAFTNWQNNFSEKTSFTQQIQIVDNDLDLKPNIIADQNIDVQILPEGGTFVQGLNNTLGVVIKNEFGLSVVPEETILLGNNKELAKVNINPFGLGKFNLNPQLGINYKLKVLYRGEEYITALPNFQSKGSVLSVAYLYDKLALRVESNFSDLQDLKLVIHNTHDIKYVNLTSKSAFEITRLILFKDLFKGANILTLVDSENKPIAERVVFNYEEIKTYDSNIIINKLNDSLRVTLQIPNASKNLNASVSILPADTKALSNNNLFAHYYLQHYLNGDLENLNYYFSEITFKKKYNLDLLCLTQGWSSYKINDLLKEPNKIYYDFEKGINSKFNINKYDSGNFMVHKLQNSKPFYVSMTEDELIQDPSFRLNNIFPLKNEKIKISEIKKDGSLEKARIFISFSPSKVPNHLNFFPYKIETEQGLNKVNSNLVNFDVEVLDEVEIVAEVEKKRYDKLKNSSSGTIDIFDDTKRNANLDFATYISSKGFSVNQPIDRQSGQSNLTILNNRRTTLGALQPPLIFLDDVLLSDFSILSNFRLDIVDYIEINKTGFGQGIRGTNGYIKIYTDPQLRYESSSYKKFNSNNFDIPLSFEINKKYYVPKYYSFQSNTFRDYGIVDWIPELIVNNNLAYLIIPDVDYQDFKIIIQGIDNEGVLLVSEDILHVEN